MLIACIMPGGCGKTIILLAVIEKVVECDRPPTYLCHSSGTCPRRAQYKVAAGVVDHIVQRLARSGTARMASFRWP